MKFGLYGRYCWFSVFLICHSARWIPNIWEFNKTRKDPRDKVWKPHHAFSSHGIFKFSK